MRLRHYAATFLVPNSRSPPVIFGGAGCEPGQAGACLDGHGMPCPFWPAIATAMTLYSAAVQ